MARGRRAEGSRKSVGMRWEVRTWEGDRGHRRGSFELDGRGELPWNRMTGG
jgi:hypothetical protein